MTTPSEYLAAKEAARVTMRAYLDHVLDAKSLKEIADATAVAAVDAASEVRDLKYKV